MASVFPKVIGLQQYLVRPEGEFGPSPIAAAEQQQRDTSSPPQPPAAITDSPANCVAVNNNSQGSGSPSPAATANNVTTISVPAAPPVSTQPDHSITEAMIKVAGRPLGEVIDQVRIN